MKIFEINPTMIRNINPFNGLWNLRKRIKNIGAKNAAIDRIHRPLEKKRNIKPNKR